MATNLLQPKILLRPTNKSPDNIYVAINFCNLYLPSIKISYAGQVPTAIKMTSLTFKKSASYIQDGRTANLQMLHFIYFFNKYEYWVF